MAKKRTIAQKKQDLFDVYKCIKEGRTVKRSIAKDGSIPTHPVVDVTPEQSEKTVLKFCLSWLKMHGVMANRHDAGTFQNERGQWGTYGIKGAGDIIGILPGGMHLEIEVKRGNGGRLSEGQQERKVKVKDAGGVYFVVHGVQELEFYMEGLV